MNINDIKDTEIMPDNIWKAIFDRQFALAQKYKEIEGMGDLLETTEKNIHTAKGQKWIKDFAWRVTEELAEAGEAHNEWISDEKNETIYKHFIEELIDALHFLAELTIIAGYDHSIINQTPICDCLLDDGYHPWRVIYPLGLMCNCLKNKPWKQTQMLTDKDDFEIFLKYAWDNFIIILKSEKLSEQDIYNFYFKKSEVNNFRIRSKY